MSKRATTYVLMGNHDYKCNRVKNYEEHYFRDFGNDKLIIVDKPILTNGMYLCPYVKEGDLWTVANKEDIIKSSISFFHQEFKGAEIRPGFPSEEGDEWPDDFPLAISGHIHTWHMPSHNICYVGTPFHHNFAKDPERKTVSLFESCDDGKWEQTRIDINIPQKMCISVDCAGFNRFEYDGKSFLKIKISDTSRKISSLSRGDKFKSYHDNTRIKILLTSVDDSTPINLTPKKITTFWEKIQRKVLECEQSVQHEFKIIMNK